MPDLERVSRLQAHSGTDVPLRAHGLTSPGLISFSPLLRKQLTPSSESLPTNDYPGVSHAKPERHPPSHYQPDHQCLGVRLRAAVASSLASRQKCRGTRQHREQAVVSGLEPDPAVASRREASTDLEVVRHVQPVASVRWSSNAATASCPRGSVGLPDMLLDASDQDRPHR